MSAHEIYAIWDGEAFKPLARHSAMLDANMVAGQRYRLTIDNERSMASHRHEFASLKDAWANLPEDIAAQFPSEEHFRKHGLIHNGFYHQREIVCASTAEARRWMRELRMRDDYAIFSINGPVIIERIAKSQSVKAMGKGDFQRSKQALLDWAWSLCGISPELAREHGGNAA